MNFKQLNPIQGFRGLNPLQNAARAIEKKSVPQKLVEKEPHQLDQPLVAPKLTEQQIAKQQKIDQREARIEDLELMLNKREEIPFDISAIAKQQSTWIQEINSLRQQQPLNNVRIAELQILLRRIKDICKSEQGRKTDPFKLPAALQKSLSTELQELISQRSLDSLPNTQSETTSFAESFAEFMNYIADPVSKVGLAVAGGGIGVLIGLGAVNSIIPKENNLKGLESRPGDNSTPVFHTPNEYK